MNGMREIIRKYATWDSATQTYVEKQPIDKNIRQKIEAELISLFTKFLVKNGVDDVNMGKQIRALRYMFHPEKKDKLDAESKWFEAVLSDDQRNDTCYKLIEPCIQALKNPIPPSHAEYKDVNNMEELLKRLYKQRASAKTLTRKALVNGIITLVMAANNYGQTVDELGPNWVQKLMRNMPFISSGVCMGIYLEELALLYAVTFSLSRGGAWLEKSSSSRWRYIGRHMRSYGEALFDTASALIAYFVSVNYLAIDYIGIQTCSGIYHAIMDSHKPDSSASPDPSTPSAAPEEEVEEACMTLAIRPQQLVGGAQFGTWQLRALALSLEDYQRQQQQQFFSSYRLGERKSSFMELAIERLKELDVMELDAQEKLLAAKPIIDNLKNKPFLIKKGSHSADAIRMMDTIYNFFVVSDEEAANKKEEEEKLPSLFSIEYIR